jgi:hypothetical protein
MSKVRRTLSVVCLLLFLGLPVAAQTERQPAARLAGFLETLWERLSAPIVSLSSIWAADVTQDPSPSPEPTSRGPWDPNG